MADVLVQQVLNWLSLGCIYALLAVGFSLLFGVLNLVHFSHGDVSLVAPFMALAAIQVLLGATASGADPWTLAGAGLVAIAAVAALGVLLERLVIRPFIDAPSLMTLVATVALGMVIRELIRHLYPQGSNPHFFPNPLAGAAFTIGAVNVTWFAIVNIVTTALILTLLFLFLHRTPLGLRIRAVSQDREAARLFGIRANRIFQATFALAAATGAVAGLAFAAHSGVTRFDFGVQAGLMGFSAAVIGGLGSMAGAIIGGLLLAGLETFVQAVVPDGTAYRTVFAFSLVIAVLVFRPVGLLGRAVVQKV
jgi:branched-subunit amino acid ABC-type transport system permease component